MLYPQNQEPELSLALFQNPTAEYRGAPFYAWNCQVTEELLNRQIGYFQEMGMGGFHIHSRTGLQNKYLGDEYMHLVKFANEKAKACRLLTWLYDEDRCPSGSAGGYVTRDLCFRARKILFSPTEMAIDDYRCWLARYEVVLKHGLLVHYRRLNEGDVPLAGAQIWQVYREIARNTPQFNGQAYVDTLNPKAIQRFVEITHARYAALLQPEFGHSIPAIFTDEPQFSPMQCLGFAEEEKSVSLPFTDDLESTFQAAYGDSLMEHLPELVWDLPAGRISATRYHYHDHVCERLASAFADTLGSWCQAHGIMLTGHMMCESSLYAQTLSIGEAMRSYRAFDLPGIDILCDWREYSTAKQAQSAAHQYGCPGVLSELYGVTNWDFDFRGHKMQGDWQAALGITVRVHHLTWMSMAGEGKRDYPACIGYQSPWFREYAYIENHYSRLNTALTRGRPAVRVGVIHPIESYWLHWGPNDLTAGVRAEMDAQFNNLIEWLLFGLIDFDFIAESLLPSQSPTCEGQLFRVGAMKYEVILVPGCETLRPTTVALLEDFQKAGGKVVFLGTPANLVDAAPSDRIRILAEKCICLPFSQVSLLRELENCRDLDIRIANGKRPENLFYQMREDGARKWLFICHVKKMNNPDLAQLEQITIRIKGRWKPTIYDTLSGDTLPCPAVAGSGQTMIPYAFYQHDSLLLYLEPGQPEIETKEPAAVIEKQTAVIWPALQDSVPVTLSEPNVLLLDTAEYTFDGITWQARKEVLCIDNLFRKQLGYEPRAEIKSQPWSRPDNDTRNHTLGLRFTIISDIDISAAWLALENAASTEIYVNNVRVTSQPDGWFVDECINRVPIPGIPKGKSEIRLRIPFGPGANVEWCYLLGDFGVQVAGSQARIIEPVRELHFGDWTQQGLPFYAGNVTYHCALPQQAAAWTLEVPQFRNPLLAVSIDGRRNGIIALAPYRLDLGRIDSPNQHVDITAFGNRVNAFGAIHNCDRTLTWFGSDSWRSTGNSWSDEYQLKPTGILISPRLYMKQGV